MNVLTLTVYSFLYVMFCRLMPRKDKFVPNETSLNTQQLDNTKCHQGCLQTSEKLEQVRHTALIFVRQKGKIYLKNRE